MPNYYRIDIEDIDEGVQEYNSLSELLEETTYFYHQTFADDEGYEENKVYTNLQEALELWEGNGYCIAEELSTGIETSSYKFEIFAEKGTIVEVSKKLYELLEAENYTSLSNKHYNQYNIQFILDDNEKNNFLEEREVKLLQDCVMLFQQNKVDFIQFEEI